MIYIEVSQEVVDRLTVLMGEGRKVDTIKALRDAVGGFGLKEYKHAVESFFGGADSYFTPVAQLRIVGSKYRIEEVTMVGPSGKVTIKGGSIRFQDPVLRISLEEVQDIMDIWNRIRE